MPRLSASRSIAALRAVPPSLSVPLTPSGARIDRVKYFGITHPPGRTTDPAAHALDELTQWRRFCQSVLDRTRLRAWTHCAPALGVPVRERRVLCSWAAWPATGTND